MSKQHYCDYSSCFMRFFKHYHSDENTITFTDPEEIFPMSYHENVKLISVDFIKIIEKHYPMLTRKIIDDYFLQDRIEMFIYCELSSMGIFK